MDSLLLFWREGKNYKSLTKHFTNTLYIKNSWERGDEDFIFIRVGGATMYNEMLHDYSACQLSREDMFVFDTYSWFWNMPYQTVHTTETTAVLRSWKKTTIGIRVSVSKVYVTFCGAAANWGLQWLLRFIENTQLDKHTPTRKISGFLGISDQVVV
jgi:hypothetical protein